MTGASSSKYFLSICGNIIIFNLVIQIMASEGGTSTVELSSNLVESLQVDFKNLSSESKKKYPQVKEVNTQII